MDKQSGKTRLNKEKKGFKLNKPSKTKSHGDFTQTNQTKLSPTEILTKQTQYTKAHRNLKNNEAEQTKLNKDCHQTKYSVDQQIGKFTVKCDFFII